MQHPIRGPRLAAILLALGLMTCAGARAESGTGASRGLSVSGFGTVGLVHSSGRWSADVDARLGLQLDLALDKRWPAVLQVVSEQDLEQ